MDSFILSIESCGSIAAKDLVAMASEEIQKRAEDLDAKLAELANVKADPFESVLIRPVQKSISSGGFQARSKEQG